MNERQTNLGANSDAFVALSGAPAASAGPNCRFLEWFPWTVRSFSRDLAFCCQDIRAWSRKTGRRKNRQNRVQENKKTLHTTLKPSKTLPGVSKLSDHLRESGWPFPKTPLQCRMSLTFSVPKHSAFVFKFRLPHIPFAFRNQQFLADPRRNYRSL